MTDLLKALSAPFDPARISWRVGSVMKDKSKGMALAYLDSRDVQDRLDAVCGAAGWQCRYPHAGQKTVCEIGVKIGDEWIWKADGAGDSDIEAEKGALSDAFKRAAVKWGVGRYLYDVESPWVELENEGKRIKQSEFAKLARTLPRAAGVQQATPQPPATPAKPAPEVDKVKNAPGVSEAKNWVREHIRELNGCGDPVNLMDTITGARDRYIRICGVYPALWIGPDGTGLRGEAQKMATAYECRPAFDKFIKEVEAAAPALNQPQAAE